LGSGPALWSRRYEQAEAGYRAVLAAHPDFSLAHYALGLCQLGEGKADDALASFRHALRGLGPDFVYPSMAHAYAALGKSAEALELLSAMLASARAHYVSPYKIAVTHVALGEYEEAFGRLAEAAANHDDRLVLLAVDPFMDPLRADPRFEALLRRVMPLDAGT
jgi:tetratricopeptide (TPR) repeat protein